MAGFRGGRLDALRAKIAALDLGGRGDSESLSLGDSRLDGCFPRGAGLPLGQWHELVGEGLEIETCAAAASFAALLAKPLAARGEVVWIARRDDLYAPGLEGLGFPVGQLIQVCVRDEAEALAALEDALATNGVAAALAEVEAVDLTAGRRLQLACERRGGTGFVIRRRPYGGKPAVQAAGTAAATRWRIGSEPSEAPRSAARGPPRDLRLGAPRWRAVLERCRGGRPGDFILEAQNAFTEESPNDGTHPLRLVAQLGDRDLASPQSLRRSA
jgi:protein ImuA